MEKKEFLKKAPIYYALGLCVALDSSVDKTHTLESLDVDFNSNDKYLFFTHANIARLALRILAKHGAIRIIEDDFGPELIVKTEKFQPWLENEAADALPIFKKFFSYHDLEWLSKALKNVDATYHSFSYTEDDFKSDDDHEADDPEWEPIPIEPDDEQLKAVVEELDIAVEAIEKDNGYSANFPRERDFVLSNLKTLRRSLKNDLYLYWIQIKVFALDPLQVVIKRFGSSAVGIVASAARTALTEWLKKKIGIWLD